MLLGGRTLFVVAEQGGLMAQRAKVVWEIFYGDRDGAGMQLFLTPISNIGRVSTSASHHELRIQHPNSICKPQGQSQFMHTGLKWQVGRQLYIFPSYCSTYPATRRHMRRVTSTVFGPTFLSDLSHGKKKNMKGTFFFL